MLEIDSSIHVVFASWTPSILSMHHWVKKEYNLVCLLEKFTF
jgi:hypothetical protein